MVISGLSTPILILLIICTVLFLEIIIVKKSLVIEPISKPFPNPLPTTKSLYECYKDFYKKHQNDWWINNFRFSYSIVGGWNFRLC